MTAHRIRIRNTRTRTLLAAGGVLLVALAVSGCGADADASDAPVEKKAFPFGGKTLTIDAGNSVVELVPADVKDVEVARQIDGWVFAGSGPDGFWRMKGDTLTLKVKCRALASNCEARHEVKVPRGVAVTVNGDNGRISATGFTTVLKLTSDNGSVTVRNSSGPVDLKSDNGTITTKGLTARTVAATAANGSVHLGLTAVPDSVDTASDNGRIVIDLPRSKEKYAVTATSENGDVDVTVPTDGTSAHIVKAHSDNGEVTIRNAS
ncbi:DUF4097 family beta strand repeat-containing protein [Streptomyces odonnellii]|uniref:DUF4097 family beta strand repeat-containing protein n=1 Tax=Streptomyces odonnellii TaxID=1417980 RepID=UPI001E64978D|nr:DUF4097 family beta strand repeat-containing protein [Streptomyces odonnellii]